MVTATVQCPQCGETINATPLINDDVLLIADSIEAEIAAIRRDVPTLHQRRCWDCGKTHWHATDRAPYVLCPDCKSQDTRKIKE